MLQTIKNKFYKKFHTSFAKSGIDLQVFQILQQKKVGTYVDVGSHHPILANNTFFFYLRNWRGICIDPNPEFSKLYKSKRPQDAFLNVGISDKSEGALNYYKLKEGLSARNSFSEDYINSNNLHGSIDQIIPIKIMTLKEVFNQNILNQPIDFLTIDCEGLDLNVLKSNDWNKYRPKVVCIETHEKLQNDLVSESAIFMNQIGYTLKGKTIQGEYVGSLLFME
jgi:FkbM family methyltransferase